MKIRSLQGLEQTFQIGDVQRVESGETFDLSQRVLDRKGETETVIPSKEDARPILSKTNCPSL
jgi:hypothetical protein